MFRRNKDRDQSQDIVVEEMLVAGRSSEVASLAIANSGGNVVVDCIDGLGRELDVFGESWQRVNTTIADFIDDPETMESFRLAISDYTGEGDRSTRMSRRDADRFATIRGLSEFVAAQVMRARLRASSSTYLERIHVSGPREGVEVGKEINFIDAQWDLILSSANEPQMGNARNFFGAIGKLSDSLKPDFKRAEKSRSKILEKSFSVAISSPESALGFLEGLTELPVAEDPRSATYLDIVTVEYLQDPANSAIGAALEVLADTPRTKGLARRFIVEQLKSGDGDNLLEFSRRIFDAHSDGRTSFINAVVTNPDIWPSELEDRFGAFSVTFTSSLREKIKRLAAAANTQIAVPTIYETKQAFDRLIKSVVGKPTHKTEKTKYDDRIRGVGGGVLSVLPQTANPEARRKGLEPAFAKPAGSARHVELVNGDQLEEFILNASKGADRPAEYEQDLRTIIKYLQENPHSSGSTNLRDVPDRIVGQKKARVLRLDPKKAQGLDVSASARDGFRVFYIVHDGKVGIVGIANNHPQYEAMIRSLQGK
jgi:hypothetical protein